MSKKTFPGSGKFDPINSTYKHEIYLKNGKVLTGYSKGMLQNEMIDKTVLLEKVILRLVNNGYLQKERTERIDFYKKEFLQTDEIILSLEPHSYVVTHDKYILDQRLNTFLKRLYESLKSGQIITKDLVDKRSVYKEEDIFKMQSGRFANIDSLKEYCFKLIQSGIVEGHVRTFFYKYSQQYF